MLMPKRVKHRKEQRGRRGGVASRGSRLQFGQYGLKTLEPAWVTARQIEAARIAMTHKIKRGGRVWVCIFPDKPVSKKPAETRMGKGKGAPGSSGPTGLFASCSNSHPAARSQTCENTWTQPTAIPWVTAARS